jgi:hypothetical protein
MSEPQQFGLIPPARFGPFVEASRHQLGMSMQYLADRSGGELLVNDIKLIETGRLACSEAQLRVIRLELGLPLTAMVPARLRLQIDPAQGRLVVGGTVAQVMPDCSPDALILRYLSLVYLCRGVRPGVFMVPRSDDVDVLSEALVATSAEVRQLLAQVTREQRDELRVAVRSHASKLVIPGLGLFVGKLAQGGLLLVDHETIIGRVGGPSPAEHTNTRREGDEECVVVQLDRKQSTLSTTSPAR